MDFHRIKYVKSMPLTTSVSVPALSLDADTTAWITAVITNGGSVSDARKTLVNDLIVGLKADGIWTLLDRLWLLADANQPSALTDLVVRALATAVNSPTFTADRGYTGNGTSSYIETSYNPGDGGTYKFLQNDAHHSFWDLSTSTADTWPEGQSNTSTSFQWFSGSFFPRVNDNGGATTPGHANGHNLVSRIASTDRTLYQDGASVGNLVIGSGAVFNATFTICGINAGGLFSDHQISMFSSGGGMTSGQVTSFYNRLRTYMTAVGVP